MPNGVSFADAEASYNEAEVCIYGIPYDRTCSFKPGAREAPMAIRRGSYTFEPNHFEHGQLPEIGMFDYGDCDDAFLPEDMIDEVVFVMGNALRDGKFTVAMGGEHSVNIPIVKCLDKNTALISIDAHLDSRDEYMGTPFSHACVMRRASEHLGLDNVYALGVRSIAQEELDRDDIVPHISAYEIFEKGIDYAIKKALDSVSADNVYLTIDIDGIDPAFAPGTGTPEPFGLHPYDVKKVINAIGDRLIGMDVCEVCPPSDPSGITSVLAARLIKEGIAVYSKRL